MDKRCGLYEKYVVTRSDGTSEPGEKHDGCQYFVLDATHDPHAKAALLAYAESCETDYPLLAQDVRGLARLHEKAGETMNGTFECPICGRPTPHTHSDLEVAIEREGRPIFENWFTHGGQREFRTWRGDIGYGRVAGQTYYSLDGMNETWYGWIRGWLIGRGLGKLLDEYETHGPVSENPISSIEPIPALGQDRRYAPSAATNQSGDSDA